MPGVATEAASSGSEVHMIFGEVGEAMELTIIFVLMTAALAAIVLLGKWWES